MSNIPLTPFTELTNFQQWVILYLKKNTQMQVQIEHEINNFCDTTKKNIDLNNFDKNMASLQDELMYFNKVGIISSDGTNFSFTAKGELYCFQNIEIHLGKLAMGNVIQKLRSSLLFKKNPTLCTSIFGLRDLSKIAPVLINNKIEAMENIKFFCSDFINFNGILNRNNLYFQNLNEFFVSIGCIKMKIQVLFLK